MSCDYSVWLVRSEFAPADYFRRYVAAADGDAPLEGDAPADQGPLEAFLADLSALYPDLGSLPDDQTEASPWSTDFDRADDGVLLCCVWSMAEQMGEVISTLARKHGLVFLDPQGSTITMPDGTTHACDVNQPE